MRSGTAQHQEMKNWGAERGAVWRGAVTLGRWLGRGLCPCPENLIFSTSAIKWCVLVVIWTSKLFQSEVYAALVLFVPYFAFYDRLKRLFLQKKEVWFTVKKWPLLKVGRLRLSHGSDAWTTAGPVVFRGVISYKGFQLNSRLGSAWQRFFLVHSIIDNWRHQDA